VQSEVEETIERIKVQHGVEGYVICNKQGQVLRRFPTMTQEVAEQYSEAMISLAGQARSVVRDLNPKVRTVGISCNLLLTMLSMCGFLFGQSVNILFVVVPNQNELKYLRVRAKRHEIVVAFGKLIYTIVAIRVVN